MKGFYHHTLQI